MSRTQTTFDAKWHPDQQRLDDVGTRGCIAGVPNCPGLGGMFFGEFPCATCWWLEPATAHYYFALWEGHDDE